MKQLFATKSLDRLVGDTEEPDPPAQALARAWCS